MNKVLERTGLRHVEGRMYILDKNTPRRIKIRFWVVFIAMFIILVWLNKAGYWI